MAHLVQVQAFGGTVPYGTTVVLVQKDLSVFAVFVISITVSIRVRARASGSECLAFC